MAVAITSSVRVNPLLVRFRAIVWLYSKVMLTSLLPFYICSACEFSETFCIARSFVVLTNALNILQNLIVSIACGPIALFGFWRNVCACTLIPFAYIVFWCLVRLCKRLFVVFQLRCVSNPVELVCKIWVVKVFGESLVKAASLNMLFSLKFAES